MNSGNDQNAIAKGLLGRGGSALLTATVARARGDRMGTHRWQALSPDIIASVEQVLGFLEQDLPIDVLETAVRQTLVGAPTASVPAWLRPTFQTSDALSFIGRHIEKQTAANALGRHTHHPSKRHLGLAAVSLALARMQDTLDTLSRHLNPDDGELLVRMGRLSAVTVRAGEPTKMRARVRELLKEHAHG